MVFWAKSCLSRFHHKQTFSRLNGMESASEYHASMMKAFTVLITTAALTACAPSLPKCSAADPTVIVAALQGREQFRQMLTSVVRSTVTVQIVAQKDPSNYEKRLHAAVNHAVERHGVEWESNLAQSYSAALSKQELADFCTAMNKNDGTSVRRVFDRVGPEMERRSKPLLQQAGEEVVEELLAADHRLLTDDMPPKAARPLTT